MTNRGMSTGVRMNMAVRSDGKSFPARQGPVTQVTWPNLIALRSVPLKPMRDPDNEDPRVIVCAGRPWCELEGDQAAAQQVLGCMWCEYITVHPDGSKTSQRMCGTA